MDGRPWLSFWLVFPLGFRLLNTFGPRVARFACHPIAIYNASQDPRGTSDNERNVPVSNSAFLVSFGHIAMFQIETVVVS